MGMTTISVKEETAERLDEYRSPEHDSWTDTIEGMMKVLPTLEEVREGCSFCDGPVPYTGTIEDTGGAILFFHTVVEATTDDEIEGQPVYGSQYFCSAECAHDAQEEVQAMVPENPDLVLVGGADELQAEYEGATFYIDRDTMEVGIPVPGAFAGTDSHGGEYDYIGEPVYIKNKGKWVQTGVIEEIIHEEAHTALLLGHGFETVMLNHPDDERREDYMEKHVTWYDQECPECEESLRVHTGMDPTVVCGECGAEFERADPPAD